VKYARYTVVSIAGGILFGVMDGLVNGNPVAVALYKVYEPIARTSVNIAAGITIDLVYGFVLAGLYLLLYPGLPGKTGLQKGASFGLLTWFLRSAMAAVSSWMMFAVGSAVFYYALVSGLVEMLALGVFYGLTLRKEPGIS